MRLEPRACRPPFRHDRNEQVERRKVRTEKPRRAGLRLHYLPKPPRVRVDVGLESSPRLLARHKPSGNVGIGVRRVDVGNHEHQPAQELGPGRRGNEIAPPRGLRQIERDRRALGHDLPVGQHQRRELHERIDRAQLLAGRFFLEEIADALQPVRQPIPGELRFDQRRAPPGACIERVHLVLPLQSPRCRPSPCRSTSRACWPLALTKLLSGMAVRTAFLRLEPHPRSQQVADNATPSRGCWR